MKSDKILVYNPRKETYEEFLKRVAKYEEEIKFKEENKE